MRFFSIGARDICKLCGNQCTSIPLSSSVYKLYFLKKNTLVIRKFGIYLQYRRHTNFLTKYYSLFAVKTL